MDNTNNDTPDIDSDIQAAAEQADNQQISQNLKNDKKVDAPQPLSEEERTSFIQDDLRTDK